MKESYEALSMEVIAFEAEDLITGSSDDPVYPGDGDSDDAIGGGYWFRG